MLLTGKEIIHQSQNKKQAGALREINMQTFLS